MTHLRIEQGGTTEYVSTAVITKLYLYAKEIKDYEDDPNNNFSGDSLVSLKGTLSVPKAYKDEVEWLTDANILDVSLKKFPDLHIDVTVGLYIRFVDPEVKRVLLALYGDGIGITREDMSSVTSLALNLFNNNTVITSFDELGQFPSIIRIKYDCFLGATNLLSIDLSNIEELGNDTFKLCSLSGIINAPQLKTIGNLAFADNVGITEINIGSLVPDQDKITLLDTATFQNCSSLTKVTGLKKVTHIGSVTFFGTDIQYLDFETPIIGLGRECFRDCTKIRCMDLSNYVPYTGNIYGMFMGCTGLIDLSTYDTSNINTGSATYTFNWDFVPQLIFCNCTSLNKAFVFPNATSVGISSFLNTKITSLSAPIATYIGNYAFKDVTTLTSVNIPSATEVGRECFEGCNGLTSIDLSSITSIGNSAFNGCTSLTTISSLSNIETIKEYAFTEAPINVELNLTRLTGTILVGTFYNSGITKIKSLGNITSIDSANNNAKSGPFRNCKSLTEVDLSTTTNLTSIGTTSFTGCTSLTTVKLPSSLTSINNWAFNSNASNIQNRSYYIYATTPPTLEDANSISCTNNNSVVMPAAIYVPSGSVTAYQLASVWSTFASVILAMPTT